MRVDSSFAGSPSRWPSNSRVPAPRSTGTTWSCTSSSNPARRYWAATSPPPATWTSRPPAAAWACSRADSIPSVTNVNVVPCSSSGSRAWWVSTNTGWWNGGSSPHHPLALGSSSHGPLPPLNMWRPMMLAPTRASVSPASSESTFASPPSRPCRSRHAAAANAHSCSSSPPWPSGSSSDWFGPATKPSSDTEMSRMSCPIVSSWSVARLETRTGGETHRPSRTLLARRELLHGPAVAVGVAEEHEPAPREVLHLADLDAALEQLGARPLDVGDDELQPLHRPGRSIGDPLADGDRAGRPARRELDEAQPVAHAVVLVGVEAGLLGVEGLRAVHVGHGDGDERELPVHVRLSSGWAIVGDCTPNCGQFPSAFAGMLRRGPAGHRGGRRRGRIGETSAGRHGSRPWRAASRAVGA